ncbi:hypothetical protein [Methanooceanicella nereidis]|nr:hypothetical protein [Methanocella sp. CWC-04]
MRCINHPERGAIGTCSRCGRPICGECNVLVGNRFTCKNCASLMAKASCAPTSRREPILALVLSFLLPGLGQIYNGDTNRGILFVIGTLMAWLLTSVCIGIFIFLGLWVYAMYDAYLTAEKINRGIRYY